MTFRERVNVADFESEHFAAQLVERLGWAVEDADVAERSREEPAEPAPALEDQAEPVEYDEPVESRRKDRVAVHASV